MNFPLKLPLVNTTPKHRRAFWRLMSTDDGKLFVAYLAHVMGLNTAQTTEEGLTIQQFAFKLFSELDLFTTRHDFPLQHIAGLWGHPRSEGWLASKEDEKEE